MIEALGSLYPAAQGWVVLPQVANATGAGSGRTADGLAMNAWPSRGLQLDGFELKSYRGDWLRELKTPAKAEGGIFRYCDRWWIVVPAEPSGRDRVVAKPEELPPSWGLIECQPGRAAIVRAAKALKPKPLDRAFLASVLRRLAACAAPAAKIEAARASGRQDGYEEGRRFERGLAERLGHRSELRYQRESLERLEEIAQRCLGSIRQELKKLAELPEAPSAAEE